MFEDLQKFNYAAQLLFPLGISLPKFSCLFFYYRVFGRSSRKLYISLWVAGALAAGWLVSAIFVVAFQCNPPQKAWDFTLEGQCLSMWPWLVGLACTSMAIDALILIMPMPQLWKLNVPWRRKATVSIIFLCGYWYVSRLLSPSRGLLTRMCSVIVCSIGRVVTLGEELAAFSSPDPLYATAPYFCWISTEGPVSVVGVCLPMIFKFIQRVHDHGFRSGYTSQHSPQPGGSAYDNQHNRHRGKGSAKSDVQAPASAHGLREMTTGSRGERNSCSALDTPYLPDDEAKRKQTAQLDMV